MIALDFFLYDNRTLSPRWGRDWGLKAATGALADRADLKTVFDRYCGAMPSEQGQLYGFGEAIGGVGSPRDDYLLCVTLECSDFFGRPSWAVIGLWCPDPSTLEKILSAGDPIGSARALLGEETPPDAIEIRPAKIAVSPRRRRRASAEPAFYRFDPRSTVREVTSLLQGVVQDRTRLPNVLGITATSRLAAIARAGFNVVYCHPMDDRTERALARVLSPQESAVEEPRTSPVEAPMPPVDTQIAPKPWIHSPPKRPAPRSSSPSLWLLCLSIGIMAAVMIFLMMGDIRRGAPAVSRTLSPSVEEAASPAGDASDPEISVPKERSAEAALGEIRERLEECKKLMPEDLSKSPGFKAAETLEVLPLPEYQERRNRVRQAYSTLIEIRGRMVKRQRNYVAYYYDEAGKAEAPDTKLKKIAEILGEGPLGGKDCGVLKEAFGFEFENGGSVVRQWCDSLGKLEKSASKIPSTSLWHSKSGGEQGLPLEP